MPTENSPSITIFEKDLRLYHPSELRANVCNLDKNCFIITGSLRDNLDPDNIHTLEEILDALKYFDLAGFISNSIRSRRIDAIVSHLTG